MDIEAFKKALEDDLADPNGYWNTIEKKYDLKKSRFPKVEKYIDEHGIKKVIDLMIKEHNEEWVDKCYNKGCEPYPSNKFDLLWSYVSMSNEHVHNPDIPQTFLGASYFYKGYWFCIYHGQGSFYRIYDPELNDILQI